MEIARGGAAETLEYFHARLHDHFAALHAQRQSLPGAPPVFALEHALPPEEVVTLQHAVVSAHRNALLARLSSSWWLCLVVHAAEIGYIYDGVEFWPIYGRETPSWIDSETERDRVRRQFRKFADAYGGAIPRGAWANTFRKIAWPITHAVLPRYLQVQLARLLYDHRTGWPSYLDDPEELGRRLHSWSRQYGERLEKFCQNTTLLGHVAVALLLSEEGEHSGYIEATTLDRLVASLNSERQSRRWLQHARLSAASTRTRNLRSTTTARPTSRERRKPATTDPTLKVTRDDLGVNVWATLPDLRPLQHLLPTVYDELRSNRATIAGVPQPIPTGGLLYATSPVRLQSWPGAEQPFLQLARSPEAINLLLAEQCRLTSGPWWVFRHRPGQAAGEVRGKFVRPGCTYTLIAMPGTEAPALPWCQPTTSTLVGADAYDLTVPAILSEDDAKALVASGISVTSSVSIQPLGLVPSDWDGESTARWPFGEPVLLRINAQHAPANCRLTINGDPFYVTWPTGEPEIFIALDNLAAGTHLVNFTTGAQDGEVSNDGELLITITETGATAGNSAGEGVRLRASPAQPSLAELFDGRSTIDVDGPNGVTADLCVTLYDAKDRILATQHRNLTLPVVADQWRKLLVSLRQSPELARTYDLADRAEITINRSGVGFARLSCERGFRPFRWVIEKRHRDSGYSARLIDRTDGESVNVTFYSVEQPMAGQAIAAHDVFDGPSRGGLLIASDGEATLGQIVPPDPNAMIRIGPVTPTIRLGTKSIVEVNKILRMHRHWKDAELPAHPFGVRERDRVLESIVHATVALLAPGKWTVFEQQLASSGTEPDLDKAQSLIGDSAVQREAAQNIASNLWRWDTAAALTTGFADAIAGLTAASRLNSARRVASFLLQLVTSPGDLLDWEEGERQALLQSVLTDPVLVRVARFAILGSDPELVRGIA
jgi:hypothetical protein